MFVCACTQRMRVCVCVCVYVCIYIYIYIYIYTLIPTSPLLTVLNGYRSVSFCSFHHFYHWKSHQFRNFAYPTLSNQDRAVRIITHYWQDGPGLGSRLGRDLPCPSRPVRSPTKPTVLYCTGSFPRVKRPGRDADHPPPSAGLRMGGNRTSFSSLCVDRHVVGWPLPL